MMKTRRSLLSSLLATGLVLGILAGCSSGPQYMSTAEDALDQQNYDQALTQVDSAIIQDSANAAAYQLKAQILRQMADTTMQPNQYVRLFERAREAEQKAIEYDPGVRSDVQGRRQLAYLNEYQRGAAAFNRGRQQGDSTAFRVAAASFGAAGAVYPDSASAHLNQAYSLINLGRQKASIGPMETYLQRADTADANAYAILGRLYITNERMEDAIPLLEEGTEVHPDNDELQSLLLNAYQRSGNMEKALEAYRQEVENDPDNATYRYNYGSLLLKADRFDAAIEQLQRAVELDPDNARSQYNLGATYVNKAVAINDSLAAIEDTVRQSQREPTEEESQRLKSLAQQRQQLFQKAIPPLERARQLSGPNGDYRQDACRALFQAYVQTEQTEKAAQVEQCAGFQEGRVDEVTGGGGSGR